MGQSPVAQAKASAYIPATSVITDDVESFAYEGGRSAEEIYPW